jgi:cellulose synthase operon protein C
MPMSMPRILALVFALCATRAWAAPDPEALIERGRYAEARPLLEAQKDLKSRYLLGKLYTLTGERELAKKIWNGFFDDYESGGIDKTSAKQLMYVALAAQGLRSWKDANDTFRDAVEADPKGKDGARANIAWAALFLEKYDAGHAEVSLDEALKILPDDVEAHTLMARVRLEQGYDLLKFEKSLAAALKKNPKYLDALALRAEVQVNDQRYEDALKTVAQILAMNPEHARARTIAAAAHLLREDEAKYKAERERVLKTNKLCSEFFHGVAEFLVREHRYLEANQLEEEAILIDPKDWVAHAALGSNLLRLGEDKLGLEALRRAWKGDRYNVRTYNLLSLFEDVIPKQYEVIEGLPFRYRVPKKEREILARYVTPMIKREYEELVKRYGFAPKGPLIMELFSDPSHYAVRTVGLPGLEALGVTFGQVITAMSPSLAKFNWGMALWHEVAHVFSIQLSRSRVPRWFTEGLAEWETARHRPDWSRHTHAELYRGLADNKLLSVAELDTGFTHARNVSHMVVTYHQSAEAVAFLIKKFGFDKAVAALKLFAQGKNTAQALPIATGVSIKQFDDLFKADLRARLKAYEGQFYVRSVEYSDVESLREQLKSNPNDPRAKGLMALALVKGRAANDAQKLIDQSEQLMKANTTMYREIALASAELAMQRKDYSVAKLGFDFLIESKGDGYDARMGLGRIAAAANNVPEAEKQYTLAKKFDPERNEAWAELGKLLMKTREEDGLKELEQAALLDCMDASIPPVLIDKHTKKARWAKVVELAPLALYVAPFDPKVHLNYARALIETGKKAEAREELAAAKSCELDEELQKELDALTARAK